MQFFSHLETSLLCPHGRVVSFFVVVLYSVLSSVLYAAVKIEGENRVVTFSKWT